MNKIQFYSRIELIINVLFGLCVFIFFGFYYNYHLYFAEQMQLFLLTGDYFLESVKVPGGFIGYIGGFLTQFYGLPFAGALIITLLLLAIQQFTRNILFKIRLTRFFFPLTFLPALNYWMMLCDEFYPFSGAIGFLGALLLVEVYISIPQVHYRAISGILLIPVAYCLLGGGYLVLAGIMLIYELSLTVRKSSVKTVVPPEKYKHRQSIALLYLPVYLLLAIAIPLIVKRYFIPETTLVAYWSEFYYNVSTRVPLAIIILFALVPLLMVVFRFLPGKGPENRLAFFVQLAAIVLIGYWGLGIWINMKAEHIMEYDYLVKNEKWKEVIALAGKEPPKNDLSLAMLNLALAKTGQMPYQMFHFRQHGINGLFLPFDKESVAPLVGNEIFYHIGLINASQQYAFESMETTANHHKMVRSLKRLAETNLINGQYGVAGKYLDILAKTLFYRQWAKDTKRYLYNEQMISQQADWGEKRRYLVSHDFFLSIKDMDKILSIMLAENPHNRLAFEYLMACYLIRKDLKGFMEHIYLMKGMDYKEIPVVYQEAVLYVLSLSSGAAGNDHRFPVSEYTKKRMQAYADIYTRYPDAKDLLKQEFSGSYWYYLHYN